MAHGLGGAMVDAPIHIILRDWNDDPIENYPAEDIWLDGGSSDDFAFCIGGPFQAGGQIPPGTQPAVLVAGIAIWDTDLPLTINSPDVNGDRLVNLSDVAQLTGILGGYAWRFDFNDDGVVNLIDVSIFTSMMAADCP